MLIQTREDALRCIRQHDHGLLSGELAHHWRGRGEAPGRLDFATVLTSALHDEAWVEADEAPECDPETGRPYDFIDLPQPRRLALYRQGLDELERAHPHVALRVSLHYCAFKGMRGVDALQVPEAERRARIGGHLGAEAVRAAEDDLRWIQFFDLLSLVVCLAPPGADTRELPRWVDAKAAGEAPDGARFALTFEGEGSVRCTPFPFDAPFEARIPYRDLPRRPFASDEDLRAALAEAPWQEWRLTFGGAALVG